MFNLSVRERFIALFLIVILLAGLSITLYQKYNSVVDVKIRAFDQDNLASGIKKININEADETDLARLPGVGKSLAQRIIEYRNRAGNFRAIEEIKKVRGIKDSLFNKIKDSIAVE